MIEAAEVVMKRRHRRIAGVEQLLADYQARPYTSELPLGVGQRPAIQRLRFGVARGDAQYTGEAIDGLNVDDVCVAVGRREFGNLDRSTEQPFRLGEIAQLRVDRGQGVADVGRVDTRRPADALDEAECVAAKDEGTTRPAAQLLLQGLVV